MSWQELPLREIALLNYGKSLPEGDRTEGDVPVYGSGGITGSHNEALVSGPGIVVGRKGTVGAVYWESRDFFPIDTVYYAEPARESIDKRFLYYLLKSLPLASMNSDAAVPGLSRENAYAVRVRVPDPDSQVRIVATLSAFDDLIENNRRRIALLEQSARLLYREWFVHLRFPGHEHVKLIDGVPEGWEKGCLSNCANVEDGDWIESKDQGGDDYRLLQVSNVGVDSFVETGNFRFVTAETFRRLNCREVLPGQILVSRMPDPIGRAWLVTKMPWKMITAVDVAIVEPKTDRVTPHYLIQHLNSPTNLELSKQHATGATRLRVSRRSLCALPVLIPPMSLQNSFDELIEDGYRMRSNLDSQIGRLAEARDLLLPRLMRGDLAV